VISSISAVRVRRVNSFCEFERCRSAYIGYVSDSAIIKRIGCYALGGDMSRFDSFLIAFLNAIINCLRLG
jgi:hypothetical protein